MMKRFVALILTLAMMLSLVMVPAHAAGAGEAAVPLSIPRELENDVDPYTAQHFMVRHWHTGSGFTIIEGYTTPKTGGGFDFYLAQYEKDETPVFAPAGSRVDSGYIKSLDSGSGTIVLNVLPDTDGGQPFETFAGFSVTTGQSAVTTADTLGNNSTLTIEYDKNIHMVKSHVFYIGLASGGSSSTALFPDGNVWKDVDTTSGKVYNTKAGLHTNKTVTSVNDRIVNMELESWYAGGRSAYVGMVLDASGSMAFASDAPTPIRVPAYIRNLLINGKNGNKSLRPFTGAGSWDNYILPQSVVDMILNSHNTDNSPLGESGYTYYVFDNRKETKEYVPLAYWEGTEVGGAGENAQLAVNLEVIGKNANQNQAFTFTVTLSNTGFSQSVNDVEFQNGVGTFTLTGAQKSKTIQGLPEGTYSLSIADQPGYEVPEAVTNQTLTKGLMSTADCKVAHTQDGSTVVAHYRFSSGSDELANLRKPADTATRALEIARQPESGFSFNSGANSTADLTFDPDKGLKITGTEYGVKLGAVPAGDDFTVSFLIRKDPEEGTPTGYTNLFYIGDDTGTGNFIRGYRGASKTNYISIFDNDTHKDINCNDNSKAFVNRDGVFGDTHLKRVTLAVKNADDGKWTLTLHSKDLDPSGSSYNNASGTGTLSLAGKDIVFNAFTDNGYTGSDLWIDDVYVYTGALADKEAAREIGNSAITVTSAPVSGPTTSSDKAVRNGGDNGPIIGVMEQAAYNNTVNNRGWYYVGHTSTWKNGIDFGTYKTLYGTNSTDSSDTQKQYPTSNNSFKEHLPDGLTASDYATRYQQSDNTSLKFFVDEKGYLHCFYAWSGNDVNKGVSFVYELDDSGYAKTEALQRAIGSFATKLSDQSPASVVSAVRFSSKNVNTEALRDELVLLDWTNDPVESSSILSLERGSGAQKGTPSGFTYGPNRTPPGWAGSTNGIAQYNYALTGGTMTYTGLQSYRENLDSRLPASIRNNKTAQQGKFVILFTDGLDSETGDDRPDTSRDPHWNAYDQAGKLKDLGYTIIAVMLTGGSVDSNDTSSDSDYTKARTFLDNVAGYSGYTLKEVEAEGGQKVKVNEYVFEADSVDDLVDLFSEEVLSMVVDDLKGYTVQDTIDPRFDLMDARRQVWRLNAGGNVSVVNTAGAEVATYGPTGETNTTAGVEVTLSSMGDNQKAKLRYNAEKGLYYLEWAGQSIPGVETNAQGVSPWNAYITLKAKDDFLGGNAVLTNGNGEKQNYVYFPGDANKSSGTDRAGETYNAATSSYPSKGFPRVTANIGALEKDHEFTDTLYLGEDGNKILNENYLKDSPYFAYIQKYVKAGQPGLTTKYTDLDALLADIVAKGTAGVTLDYYYLSGGSEAHQKEKLGTIKYTWTGGKAEGKDQYTLEAVYTPDPVARRKNAYNTGSTPVVTDAYYPWTGEYQTYKDVVGAEVTRGGATDKHTVDYVSGALALELDIDAGAIGYLQKGDKIAYTAILSRQYTQDEDFKTPVRVGTCTISFEKNTETGAAHKWIKWTDVDWEDGYESYADGLPIGDYTLEPTEGTIAPTGITLEPVTFRFVEDGDRDYFRAHHFLGDSNTPRHAADEGKYFPASFRAERDSATAKLGTAGGSYIDQRYAVALIKAAYDPVSFSAKVEGTKLVNGSAKWEGDEFTFTIAAHADTPDAPLPDETEVTAKGSGGGANVFSFDIPFSKEGTYKYTVTESDSGTGYTVKPGKVYTVTVTVGKDPQSSTLLLEGVGYAFNGETQEKMVFNNVNFKPKKTLTAVNGEGYTGDNLNVGDLLTYQITWQNYQAGIATVTVTDTLKDSLEFVYAVPAPDAGTTGRLENGTTPLKWTFKNQPAGASGKIELHVRVTEKALAGTSQVTNKATVQVGLDEGIDTTPDTTNDVDKGTLVIEKKVEGETGSTKPFTFTLNLTYPAQNVGGGAATKPLTGEYHYTANGANVTDTNGATQPGYLRSGATFTLAHGQKITIEGLPAGAKYTVEEMVNGDYTPEFTADNQTGQIKADDAVTVPITNHSNQGNSKVIDPRHGRGGVQVGDEVEYTIRWTNNTGSAAKVVITDKLAAGLEFVEASDEGVWDEVDTITWTFQAGADETGTVKVRVRVTQEALKVDIIKNTAIIDFNDGQDTYTPSVSSPVQKGNLIISKTVIGTDVDYDEEFTFTVTLFYTDEEGTQKVAEDIDDLTFSGMTFKKGIATFTLSHGQEMRGIGLPAGLDYTVVETEVDGYDATFQGDAGTILNGDTVYAVFVNHKDETLGSLTVSKFVTGAGGETDRKFNFTVTLYTDRAMTKVAANIDDVTYGDMYFQQGKATFKLQNGKHKTATKLPDGLFYKVEELEANQDGYTTEATGATGQITANGAATAAFTNRKDVGGLTVVKVVTGTAGDQTTDFNFKVELGDKTINGEYGDMEFTNGVAEFPLHHGQRVTATDLPAGISYKVTELEADEDDYTTIRTGASGTVVKDQTATATFTNHRNKKLGSLAVIKLVAGDQAKITDEFEFTVTLRDTTVNGAYGDMEFENGEATFKLQHGQSAIAYGLPAGMKYTVQETDSLGYTVTVEDAQGQTSMGDSAQGEIEMDQTQVVRFTNTKGTLDTGILTIFKVVEGSGGNLNDTFHFTVESGDKSVVAEFDLKHGQSATVTGLPNRGVYTVREDTYPGYAATYNGKDVDQLPITITRGQAQLVTVTNHRDAGILTVMKLVTGATEGLDRAFRFALELTDKTVNGLHGDLDFEDGYVEFDLANGESVTALDLPAGARYTVTELNANKGGYTTTVNGEEADRSEGEVAAGGSATVTFVNNKTVIPAPQVGDLTVTKTVTGNAGNTSASFAFEVTLSDTTINGAYGGLTFENGKAAFALKHDESITAEGLPVGLQYTVEETDSQGHTVTYVGGKSGTIAAGKNTASVINTKSSSGGGGGGGGGTTTPTVKPGNLSVSKSVAGLYGDKDREFQFTVTLSSKSVNGTYGDLTFKSGVAAFTLKHGQTKTAIKLPAGIIYTVAEAADADYTTTSTGATGVIGEDMTQSAAFVNTKNYTPPGILDSQHHYGYIIGYPDGNVDPYGNITRSEIVTILFRLLTDEARAQYWSQDDPYSDVSIDDWFNNAISTMSNVGIVTGYSDGTFRPRSPITRAELATVIARFFEVDESAKLDHPFTDVPADSWYARYVDIAATLGLVEGYGGSFRPGDNLTRAEAMTIFNRLLNHRPYAGGLLNNMIRWPDNTDTGAWYYAEVQEATNSHESEDVRVNGEVKEKWTKLLQMRPWAALERAWSDAYDAPDPYKN